MEEHSIAKDERGVPDDATPGWANEAAEEYRLRGWQNAADAARSMIARHAAAIATGAWAHVETRDAWEDSEGALNAGNGLEV